MGRKVTATTIKQKWENNVQPRLQMDHNGCWIWPGLVNHAGYGMVTCDKLVDTPNNKSHIPVHKLSYLYYNSHIPKDTILLHSCDNRRCCNPDHLRPGTHLENMRDARDKGRLGKIDYVIKYGCTRGELAKRLGQTPGNISNRIRKWGNPYYNPK